MNKKGLNWLMLLPSMALAAEGQFFSVQEVDLSEIKRKSSNIRIKKEEKAVELKEAFADLNKEAVQEVTKPLAVSQIIELMKQPTGEDGRSAADIIIEREAQEYSRRMNEQKYAGLSLDLRFIHDEEGLNAW